MLTTQTSAKEMDEKYIAEARKRFNIDEEYMLDYIDELNLWIIGSFGCISWIDEGVECNGATIDDFPSINATSRADINYYFLPYLDECHVSEGFGVWKL